MEFGSILTISVLSMQCYNALVWHVWTGAFIQEVCELSSLRHLLHILTLIFYHWYFVFCCSLLLPLSSSFSRAFVFFSSPLPKEFVNHIKSDSSLLPRIAALREVQIFILLLYASFYMCLCEEFLIVEFNFLFLFGLVICRWIWSIFL